MKRTWIFGFALAAIMAAGCNSGAPATKETTGGDAAAKTGAADSNEKKLVVGIVFDTGGVNDQSFNASANEGIKRAVAELGIEEKILESKAVKDYEDNLNSMVDQGCDLVIGIGINMQEAMQRASKANPDAKFAIVDAVVEEPNVRSLLFNEEQGSFLVGYLAGKMTKTNKIGFVGGQQIDLILKFFSGYAAGAKTANPNVEILPEKFTGDWNNVDVAKATATQLFGSGADIVFHAAGKAGLGVINAAKEQGKWAIGVDSDQDHIAEGRVLTSMVKRVDEAVFQTIKDLKEGNFSAGAKVYDLKAGGVGISALRFTKDVIGAENLAAMDAQKEKIMSGELKVPTTKADLETYLKSLKG